MAMVEEDAKHLITVLGFSWLLLNFAMKLRSDIDHLRNRIVFQLDKDMRIEDKKVRKYMLDKDIKERADTLIFLIFIYAFAMITIASMTTYNCEGAFLCFNSAMIVLIYVLGVLGLVGGLIVVMKWRKDYKDWKDRIEGTLPNPTE